MVVYVESAVFNDPHLKQNQIFENMKDQLSSFKEGELDLTDLIDFIVCLGGDGTLIYASSLFQVHIINLVKQLYLNMNFFIRISVHPLWPFIWDHWGF